MWHHLKNAMVTLQQSRPWETNLKTMKPSLKNHQWKQWQRAMIHQQDDECQKNNGGGNYANKVYSRKRRAYGTVPEQFR